MVARIMNNLASVNHLRGDLAGALRLYRSALAAFQRLGDRRYIAETYHNLALAFRQAADLHQAESAAAHAIRHAEALDDVALRALAVTGGAELRVQQGEIAFAHQELDRGRAARARGRRRSGRRRSHAGSCAGVAEGGELPAGCRRGRGRAGDRAGAPAARSWRPSVRRSAALGLSEVGGSRTGRSAPGPLDGRAARSGGGAAVGGTGAGMVGTSLRTRRRSRSLGSAPPDRGGRAPDSQPIERSAGPPTRAAPACVGHFHTLSTP